MKHLHKFESHDFDKALADRFRQMAKYKASDEFWDFVDKVGWINCKKNNRLDSKEHILKVVAPHFTWDQFNGFQIEYTRLLNYLGDRYESLWLSDPDIDVSDDGWWDLRSSVIGYGKERFLKVISDDGEEITRMGNRLDYCENFGYVFHLLNEIDEEEWDQIYNKNNQK